MSKALIMAAELIKEECSKHKECKECFYYLVDEEGLTNCITDYISVDPSRWDLNKLRRKKND